MLTFGNTDKTLLEFFVPHFSQKREDVAGAKQHKRRRNQQQDEDNEDNHKVERTSAPTNVRYAHTFPAHDGRGGVLR